MNDLRVHAVILANEDAEHLWPLSRKMHPKQTLPFLQDKSLLEQTIERISSYIPQQRRWVLTTVEHEEHILEKVGHNIAGVIVEPEARGTASAMLLAAMLIVQNDSEAILLFLPSDHYIPQKNLFLNFIDHALDYVATHEKITVLGLRPTHTSHVYEYIQYDKSSSYPARIVALHEHSTNERAENQTIDGWLWNSKIVASKAQTFIDSLKAIFPEMWTCISTYIQGCDDYTSVESLSFNDILKASDRVTVLPADFIWHDTQNLETFLFLRSTFKPDDNLIQIDAKNNLVEAEGALVAVVGVDNLCIIKKDDILLVVHRDQVNKVKQIIDTLKKNHKEEYL